MDMGLVLPGMGDWNRLKDICHRSVLTLVGTIARVLDPLIGTKSG